MSSPVRVSDIMRTAVITVSPSDEVTYAVRLMIEHDVSGLPVVDSADSLVGMLTERDCIEVALSAGYFDELGGLVADFMSSPVQTANADENLVDVAQRLCKSPYRRFPVVRNGKLIGLVSRRDVLHSLQSSGSWFGEPHEPAR